MSLDYIQQNAMENRYEAAIRAGQTPDEAKYFAETGEFAPNLCKLCGSPLKIVQVNDEINGIEQYIECELCGHPVFGRQFVF